MSSAASSVPAPPALVGAELARLVGYVPALHDMVELIRPLVRGVLLNQVALTHTAAQGPRHLLALADKILLAQGAAELREHL